MQSRLGADSWVQDVTWIIRDCSALLPGTKLCTTSAKNVSLWNDGLSTIPTPTVSTEGAWSAAAATAFTRSVFLQERGLCHCAHHTHVPSRTGCLKFDHMCKRVCEVAIMPSQAPIRVSCVSRGYLQSQHAANALIQFQTKKENHI